GWSAFPILFLVTSSFKFQRDIFTSPPVLLGFEPTLSNYRRLLAEWPQFFAALGNSLIVTVGATVLAVAVSFAAGYAYSRYRGRLLTSSAFFMVAIRMVPPVVISIPLFPWMNYLGLNDTHLLLILIYAAFHVSVST